MRRIYIYTAYTYTTPPKNRAVQRGTQHGRGWWRGGGGIGSGTMWRVACRPCTGVCAPLLGCRSARERAAAYPQSGACWRGARLHNRPPRRRRNHTIHCPRCSSSPRPPGRETCIACHVPHVAPSRRVVQYFFSFENWCAKRTTGSVLYLSPPRLGGGFDCQPTTIRIRSPPYRTAPGTPYSARCCTSNRKRRICAALSTCYTLACPSAFPAFSPVTLHVTSMPFHLNSNIPGTFLVLQITTHTHTHTHTHCSLIVCVS